MILKSTDAGRNWTSIYFSPYVGLNAVSFLRNSPSGFAVGQLGVILKTDDAGGSFTDLSGETNNMLLSVFFVNHQVGYATGFDPQSRSGTILKWQ
jgi:photosystem II stability/assembly factor-like uncharacterized protein